MKLLAYCLVFICILLRCGQFPNRFERIESDKLRLIAFTYSPMREALPGDTITVTAHFAGRRIVSVDSFAISFSAVTDLLAGIDTSSNITELPMLEVKAFPPDSFVFKFKVSDTVLNGMITEAISASAVNWQRGGQFPLTTFIQSTTDMPPELVAIMKTLSSTAHLYLRALAENGSSLRLRSSFVIRFNKLFSNYPLVSPFLPINRNPKITWFGICAVKGSNVTSFHPSNPKFHNMFSITYLYNEKDPSLVSDTILIDTGYSYFLVADSAIICFDGTNIPQYLRIEDSSTLSIKLGTFRSRCILGKGTFITNPFIAPDSILASMDSGKNPVFFYLTAGDTLFNSEASGTFLLANSANGKIRFTSHPSAVEFVVTTRDFGINNKGTIELEQYYYRVFYENLDRINSPLDSAIVVVASGNSVSRLLPPVDTTMKNFRLWIVVTDDYLGEFNRPKASAVRSAKGVFKFTPEYCRKHKK